MNSAYCFPIFIPELMHQSNNWLSCFWVPWETVEYTGAWSFQRDQLCQLLFTALASFFTNAGSTYGVITGQGLCKTQKMEKWSAQCCLQAARLPQLSGEEGREEERHRHSVLKVCGRNAMEAEDGVQGQLLVGAIARERFPEELILGLVLQL